MIYADNAATTSLSRAAMKEMTRYLTTEYANPSGVYPFARRAAEARDKARQTVASCINAKMNEIYFTSGGTESDNWALRSAAENGAKNGKRHIVSTKFEHHAVLHTLEALSERGYDVTYVDIPPDGIVRSGDVLAALREDTCLVSVMMVNNEVGTIQPVAEIGRICRERGITFHTDAVQAAGHIPIDVQAMNVDMLSMSAHKFHGPKGVGVLYCRREIELAPLMYGGGQERGLRPGTENVAGIVGLSAALDESCRNMERNTAKILLMRQRLIDGLLKIHGCHLNSSIDHGVPGTVNVCFDFIEGESLVFMLSNDSLEGICASSGSACTSGSLDPSHVLLAMGVPKELARGSVRFSINELNTMGEMGTIVSQTRAIVPRLRRYAPVENTRKVRAKHED